VIDAELAEVLEPLRAAYEGRAIPAVFVPGAVSIVHAARLCAAVEAAERERFDVAHRGRYERTSAVRDAELEGKLHAIAEHFARRPLAIASIGWIVMRHGDYALARDDDAADAPGRAIELTLDVSPRASGEADLVYARAGGGIVFAAPQEPRGLAIVERVAGVRRYERYLTHRVGDLVVTRMRMRLETR
jgi:hypothetical protein